MTVLPDNARSVVDAHVHIGASCATGFRAGPADVLTSLEQTSVDVALVMPQPRDPGIAQAHVAIRDMAVQNPGRVHGIACIDPRLDERTYGALFERYVDEYGFVAVKLHTSGFGIAPDDPLCEKVFRSARSSGIPVIVHTGLGGPHTLPGRMAGPLAKFDDVPVVLAHAGFAAFSAEAIEVAARFPQVYLEPSWCPTFSVRRMLDELGPERILFGSDHPDNIAVEFARFDALDMNKEQRDAVLGATASRLFGLDSPAQTGDRESA